MLHKSRYWQKATLAQQCLELPQYDNKSNEIKRRQRALKYQPHQPHIAKVRFHPKIIAKIAMIAKIAVIAKADLLRIVIRRQLPILQFRLLHLNR